MNLLVAGGLLLIGAIALVALFFVIRSTPDDIKESVKVPPPAPIKQEEPEAHANAHITAPNVSTPSVSETGIASTPNMRLTAKLHPLANGQFYELKNELHSLHDQAQELEYRIRTLVAMVERVEQTQSGRFPIEEQSSASSDTQTLR